MSGMVTEPPIGRDGRRLLYRVRQFRAAYPLALDSDRRGAEKAVAGGFLKRKRGDPHFVMLTAKGDAYLDRMMRCE